MQHRLTYWLLVVNSPWQQQLQKKIQSECICSWFYAISLRSAAGRCETFPDFKVRRKKKASASEVCSLMVLIQQDVDRKAEFQNETHESKEKKNQNTLMVSAAVRLPLLVDPRLLQPPAASLFPDKEGEEIKSVMHLRGAFFSSVLVGRYFGL